MITIDSQIWIYFFDAKALEHHNVASWMEGDEKEKGALFSEDILLSSIIPVEVAHHLFKLPRQDKTITADLVESTLIDWLSWEKCHFADIDQFLVLETLKILSQESAKGMGGRDALILATMGRLGVQTIITHDKGFLSLQDYRRIDPCFKEPLVLDIGEEFDLNVFRTKIKALDGKN
jgi:predicted nucleic acid-binding protein